MFIHVYIYAYKYACLCVCMFGEGNCFRSQESCPGESCPKVRCPVGGRSSFPMQMRARDLVSYATMYTSAFVSLTQYAFKAPSYEAVRKSISSCFIYYGEKVNIR